jgi:hypothetical protein
MKKLLKAYGFNSDMQYFEMVVESVINGQRTQAKEQFKAMPKDYRKSFVKAIYGNWTTPLGTQDKEMFFDLL